MNYQEMNREERYFCFLLGHALLISDNFRKRFCSLVNNQLIKQSDLPEGSEFLSSNALEVYLEAAWLRDYWYWNIKSKGRLEVLKKILEGAFPKDGDNENTPLYEAFGLGLSLDELDEFEKVTKKTELKFLRSIKRKANTLGEITSPGLWGLTAIKDSGLPEECQLKLARLKWAFNAKPDLMLVSGGQAVLIEAKVESREDKYTFAFKGGGKKLVDQTDIQSNEISRLMKFLSEKTSQDSEGNSQVFRDMHFLLLTKKGKRGIHWQKTISSVLADNELKKPEIDDFTKQGFAKAKVLCK